MLVRYLYGPYNGGYHRRMKTSAVILTGGRSRRFGGVHKPGTELAGAPVVSRILAAVRGADRGALVWVVGPPDGLSSAERATVSLAVESPRYGGPLAGVDAAVTAMRAADARATEDAESAGVSADSVAPQGQAHIVFVLAGDMPLISPEHLRALAAASAATGAPASSRDADGHLQYLCAAWPELLLRQRIADIGETVDRPVRLLYEGIETTLVTADSREVADFDTPEDFHRVRAELAGRGRPRSHTSDPHAHRSVPPELPPAADRAATDPVFAESGERIRGTDIEEILAFASRVKHSRSELSPILAVYLAGQLHGGAGGRPPRPASASLAEVEAALGEASFRQQPGR